MGREQALDREIELLDRVRGMCKNVANQASYVHINYQKIPDYAVSLLPELGTVPALDPCSHYANGADTTMAFIIILDSINFGSGYFPHLWKREGRSGYYTIASSLTNLFVNGGGLTASKLKEISASDCAEIFGQGMDDPAIAELMLLFSRAMNDLGSYLLQRFEGSFSRVVAEAGHSAARLIDILRQMPLFVDEERYRGIDVPFYKRAQITASDLAITFGGAGPGYFYDLDQLTIFADNMVPHVLRVDSILTYDSDLLERITRQELIAAGSEEEIEIRACAVHAAELMVEALGAQGKKVISQQLDNALWNRGQKAEYKKIPRHRTRTTNY